ncbi:unique hypothetical protein [Mycoplasmoides gallisepticum str. R(low)]|uniref:Uncharacterized protein n=1 Tax=Mycoplasmoides gallisepticum (strain R(low / passage 15 / clone 2)) TaxID=710127 RepID=Q7NBW9_MYCGA|nr:hypothetical protein [Mycoplasmoides gallisepticum]AAP56491.1 unique hypothetical protein [Mycoplasmoides gallisepticum str. R(low)]ADC30324.1 hypothetical protein MGAH_0867 [Mycoplasmoides gallisepticum str. R(high)]
MKVVDTKEEWIKLVTMKKNKIKDPLKANYFKLDLVPAEFKPSRKKSYIYLGIAIAVLLLSLVFVGLSAAPYVEILNRGVTQAEFVNAVETNGFFTRIYTPDNSTTIQPGTVGLDITPLVRSSNDPNIVATIRIAIGAVSIFLFVLFIILIIVSYMYFLGSIKAIDKPTKPYVTEPTTQTKKV